MNLGAATPIISYSMNVTSDNSDSTFFEWREGQPYSSQFQDVYFSTENGLAETEYVFLQGNDLAQRFSQLEDDSFTIIETGFGTGLNFLCAARLWLSDAPAKATLHFITTEKYPLTANDMAASHKLWPKLKPMSLPLLAQYASLLNGETVSLYDGRIQLTLFLGDANQTLGTLHTQADAWFLDGFAPAKNPEMWQQSLFQKMATLSEPDTTFATFTSASDVRRGLQAAGFEVKKRHGFGKKREMIVGIYTGLIPE